MHRICLILLIFIPLVAEAGETPRLDCGEYLIKGFVVEGETHLAIVVNPSSRSEFKFIVNILTQFPLLSHVGSGVTARVLIPRPIYSFQGEVELLQVERAILDLLSPGQGTSFVKIKSSKCEK